MKNRSIEIVLRKGLCTGCGTCAGICPYSAIEMCKKGDIYLPFLSVEKCRNCGICLSVCPGISLDFKELDLIIFGKEASGIIGNYIKCYTGYAVDHQVRYDAASGGVITSLLTFALKEGIINGALVTKMSENYPLDPQPFIATTPAEIVSAMGSKYCPVPANKVLSQILRKDGKFAVVGLPCHIQGIRKAEKINESLKRKISLHLGLFCATCVNFSGIEFLLQNIGIRKENVIKMNYRGSGWPGGMSIYLRNGTRKFVSFPEYWSLLHIFMPIRCTLCFDATSELADISFGDAWLPEFSNDEIGRSMVISRSEIGEEILQKAIKHNVIKLREIDSKKVIQSQERTLSFKKHKLRTRMLFLHVMGKSLPIYNPNPPKPVSALFAIRTLIESGMLYQLIYISSKRHLRPLLKSKYLIYLAHMLK